MLIPYFNFTVFNLNCITMSYSKKLLFGFLLLVQAGLYAQVLSITETDLSTKLQELFPKAKIKKMATAEGFAQNYELILAEPYDHNDPEAGTFDHYVYLTHRDFSSPVVLVTEGYWAVPVTYELTDLLGANQVQVEYRFYGKSKPDSIPWNYLKNDQAIEDYHQLVTKLKMLYKGDWISTGISKGGETVLIYKSKYPDDVEVAVPYVAPLINGQEDPRTEEHIKTVGTEGCRNRIEDYQRQLLVKRDSVLVEINEYALEEKMTFTIIPPEEALEYAVLEFPFSFWQWGGQCEDIPLQGSSAKVIFDYLNKIVSIGFYNDQNYDIYLPSYYQHMTELGYYGFDTTPVEDLLQVVHHPTNLRFAPQGIDLSYDPVYISRVRDYVESNGDQILFIYGELDTWGACAPNPEPDVDALKMVLKGGSHKTRIKDFSMEDREKIYQTLKKWLGPDAIAKPVE